MARSSTKQERGQQQGRSLARQTGSAPMVRQGRFPLGQLRSEFDRLFEDFFRGWPALEGRESQWDLDVEDQDDKIVVRAEAPGFEPEDFDIQVRDNQLVLTASEQEESTENGGRRWHRRELYEVVTLPYGVDAENIDAQYRNGILTITVPKTESGKGRRVEVKA